MLPEMKHDPQQRAEQATREFRRMIVEDGIVTEEQAQWVSFDLVNPADHPDVPRCACKNCKSGRNFMAFCIEEGKLSGLQMGAVIAAFNVYCQPFIPAASDLSKWRRQ